MQKICIKRKEKKKKLESQIESSEVETRYFPDVVNPAMHSIGEYKDDEEMNFLVRAQQEASDLPRSLLERGEIPFPLLRIVPLLCRNTRYILAIHASGDRMPDACSLSGGIVLQGAYYVTRENTYKRAPLPRERGNV